MAIQVSGTEVISNARALNNIASVDATTAASITAAGVGGSAPAPLAGESITAGNLVTLQGGELYKAQDCTLVTGGTYNLNVAINPYLAGFYQFENHPGKIFWAYQGPYDASPNVYIRVGTLNNGSVSWGSATYLWGSAQNNNFEFGLGCDNSGNFVLTFSTYQGGYIGLAVGFSVSGTTVSGVTNVLSLYSGEKSESQAVGGSTAGNFLMVYAGPSNNVLVYRRITKSGTSLSAGSPNNLGSGVAGSIATVMWSSALSRYVVIGCTGSSDSTLTPSGAGCFAFTGTMSGDTLTKGTVTANYAGGGGAGDIMIRNLALPWNTNYYTVKTTGTAVWTFKIDSSTPQFYSYTPMNASGSVGRSFAIDPATGSGMYFQAGDNNYALSSIPTKFVSWAGGGNFGTVLNMEPASITNILYSPDSNNIRGQCAYIYQGIYYIFVFVYSNSSNPGVKFGAWKVSNIGNFIGVSQETKTAGQACKISVLGAVNSNQTGLTAGAVYGPGNAGGVTATAYPTKVIGKAITTTQMLVTTAGL
jgi:hypothetical protein